MKLFIGTASYIIPPESKEPSIVHTLVYYLGDVSDSRHNFANISFNSIVYVQKITRFGKVAGL